MGYQRIVGIEVAGYDTGVGIVAVLRFQTERVFCAVALHAKAAGIAVAIDLDESLLGFHFLEFCLLVYADAVNGGTAVFSLRATLQAERMPSFA